MKKAKKKNPQEALEPQKIEYRFTPDRMIFSFDGREFYLPREKAGFLFGRNTELEFEKANNEDEDFSAFEKVENLALLEFYSKRQMPIREIAKELNFPVDKYVRWLNRKSAGITRLMKSFKMEIDKRVAELDKENPLPEPKEEKKFWPDPGSSTGKKVAVMLLDGLGPREIAQKLKASYGPFLKWYGNKENQNWIMRMRNEEAEKRRREAEKDAAQNE